jgi:aminodeoxyfutalosine deaminase
MRAKDAKRIPMIPANDCFNFVVCFDSREFESHRPLLWQVVLAELHLHLEGSIEPETLVEMNPSLTIEEVRGKLDFSDFPGFLKSYVWVNRRLQSAEHYALAARRCFEKLSAQDVGYVEVTLSAGVILWKEQKFHAIFDALVAEVSQAPLQVRWVFDAIRQFGHEGAMRVAELAVERKDDGVVAFGIGGDEVRGPAEWFRDVFAFAKRNGLALVPHAGETDGPASIWACLELGADRIGHGIRAAEDPELMRRLRDDNIPLEVCITSNVCTGAVRSLAEHPVRKLYDAGVPITINTDDPALFRTSLHNEYAIARDRFGISEPELTANGFRYALDYRPTSLSSASSSLPASDQRP